MVQDLGTGYILIQPSTKGLGKAIEDSLASAVQSASKSGGKTILSRIGGAFTSVGKVGLAAIGTIGGGLAALTAKGGFDRALNIERAQTKLKALGHDTQSVDAIMDDALNSVKGTAFGLGDAASVAATMVASGIQSGTQLETVLGTVGDAAQIAGVGFKDMGVIFSQVAAKGKLQGDEMLQLMQAGIPVLQYLADHYKTTTAEAQEMVSAGKVSFADFEAAMREHIGGAAQSAGESFDGMVGNVKAAIGRLGEQFETPLLNAATKVGGKLIPIIDQTTSATGKLADQFAGRLDTAASIAAQKIEDLGNSIASGKTSIADLAAQAATLAGGFATLATVGGNADKIVSVLDQLGKSGDKGIADLIANLKKGGSDIGGAFDAIKTQIANAKGYLSPSLRDAMAIDGDPFANAVNRIRQGGSQLASATDGIFNTIRTKLTPGMANLAFKWENSGLYTGLTNTATGIKTKTGQIGDAITKGLATAAGKINTSPLGSAITAMGNKTKPLFKKTIRDAMTLDGDPFASALSKISGKTSAITGKISSLAAPFKTAFGNIFGGLGDAIGGPLQNAIGSAGGKLQSGLDTIGNLVTRFFAPGHFIKFLGIGALAAALVAGIGMINSQMGGQLSRVINSAFASLPDILSKAETWIQSSLPQFISSGTYIIEMVLQGITTALPSLVSVGTLLIDTIVTSLASHLPVLMPMAVTLVTTLVTSLIAAAPQLMSAGLTLLDGLLQGIVASLPTLAAAIPQIITAIITALATGLPQLMEQGVQMVMNLVNGLVAAMPQLVAYVPKIISTIINGLCANLPNILSTGMQMLVTLVTGLAQALPQLVAYVPQIIAGIVNTIASHLPQILSTGVQMLVTLASGFVSAIPQLVGRIPAIISSIKNAFTGVNWGGVGMNIIKGIGSGIASAAGSLVDAAVNAAKSAIDTVKGWLGIHSPSTRFRDEVGRMIGEGLAIGIRRETSAVSKAGSELAAASMPASIPLPGFDESALRASVQETATRYLPVLNTAATVSGHAPTARGESIVTVNIDAQGTDPDVLYAMFETRTRAAIDKWGI
ncbi:tape measure protein [Bifidobacterium longum]|uniref:tape measure protein n=1 Tax=Bifidobacterium longum TaxID=216816 RepID=UPI0019258D86|nr:tape measure protein [Bifidobacterium longum]MBL3896553.1 tape measure protein [Bifidobacterium longum subsp. suis]